MVQGEKDAIRLMKLSVDSTMLALAVGGLLFYLCRDTRKAHEEAEDAPWQLLQEIEECDNARHGAEHSAAEVEAHILEMEKRESEMQNYLAEQREGQDLGTRF
jgi:hypothetical protein